MFLGRNNKKIRGGRGKKARKEAKNEERNKEKKAESQILQGQTGSRPTYRK